MPVAEVGFVNASAAETLVVALAVDALVVALAAGALAVDVHHQRQLLLQLNAEPFFHPTRALPHTPQLSQERKL